MLHPLRSAKLTIIAAAAFVLSACETGYNKESSSSDESSSSSTSSNSSSSSSQSSSESSQAIVPYNSDSIMGILSESGEYTFLVRVIEKAGLATDLDNLDLTFTLFAPKDIDWFTNSTGAGAEGGLFANALQTDGYAEGVIGYHLVNESIELPSPAAPTETSRIQMSGGNDLILSNVGGLLSNELNVSNDATQATNGVIYSVDGLLQFHDGPGSNIESLNQLSTEDRFSELMEDLESTGIFETLNEDGARFTLFAPNRTAYKELEPNQLSALRNEPNTLLEFLNRHLIAEQLSSLELFETNGGSKNTVFGNTLEFSIENKSLMANGKEIKLPPKVANGVTIYEIDSFIDEGFTYPTP